METITVNNIILSESAASRIQYLQEMGNLAVETAIENINNISDLIIEFRTTGTMPCDDELFGSLAELRHIREILNDLKAPEN